MKDSQFVNYLVGIGGALFGFLILMIVVANLLTSNVEKMPDTMVTKATNARIKPVGEVTVGGAPVAVKTAAFSPSAAFQANCFACHGTGAAGAPKISDKSAWKPRIAQGKATLYKHALGGFKGMPPKGGSSLSDSNVKAVIDYMVSKAK